MMALSLSIANIIAVNVVDVGSNDIRQAARLGHAVPVGRANATILALDTNKVVTMSKVQVPLRGDVLAIDIMRIPVAIALVIGEATCSLVGENEATRKDSTGTKGSAGAFCSRATRGTGRSAARGVGAAGPGGVFNGLGRDGKGNNRENDGGLHVDCRLLVDSLREREAKDIRKVEELRRLRKGELKMSWSLNESND